jgi:flagellar M-ring protein FliF
MNQNLSKLGTQLLEIWKQLGVSQRVSVLAATVVVLGGLISIAAWSSRSDYGLLYGKLSDSESSKVIAALDDAKVPYKIGSGGNSILVPADKVHQLRMQLAGRGIPQGDGVGFEIFDKPNFGISDFVQRANYIRAVQGELSRTVSQLDEIESARVMIVLPENRLLLDKDKHPTASVFIRVRGNTQIQPTAINSIRFLVANSVEGLKPNNVSIVDNLGNVLSENTDNDSLTGLTTTQLTARRNLEQYLGKKAQDVLEKVLGPGQAIVRVSADINFDTITRTEEKFDPDGQVVRSQTKNDENTDSTTSNGGNTSAAGISSNTATDEDAEPAAPAPVASAPANSSKNRKTVSTIEYEVGKSTSSIIQAAGGIKRLSASVTIASRLEGEGEERKVVPRTEEELEKLRRIVQNAVGTDNSRGDQIALEELPFNDQFAMLLTQDLNQQQKHQFWWDLARNAVYPALGLLALIFLVVMFKKTPIQDIPIGVPVGRIVGHKSNGHGNGHDDWTREPQPGVVTIDVLNRLVKENPANMTQAIREWMNKGRTTEN